jgi:PKD domain
MSARVTQAVNVRGEHRGQRLRRTWTVRPQNCSGAICAALVLDRERSAGHHDTLTLFRIGRGVYAGHGAFDVALRCRGVVYPHGAHAPYRIALHIRSARLVHGVPFAQLIKATYSNRFRRNTTPCRLGASHDAARYQGVVRALPGPPAPSFTATASGATVAFADTSQPGPGGSPIAARLWDFGDGTTASDPAPAHTYAAPGTYTATLTVTDENGFSAATSQQVTVPAPASPGRREAR